MSLPLYQVDAFAEGVFSGNPAAVVPLAAWLPDETLLAIAEENNLSETAFFVPLPPESGADYTCAGSPPPSRSTCRPRHVGLGLGGVQ
jgi:PhzF family phenazine biosynthesis protein